MQAVVITGFGDPDVLESRELPAPEPGPAEVVVRVAAVGVNNTDVWTRAGAYGTTEPAGWLGPVDFPRVPGADVCGHVVEVGAETDRALLGRRVLVDPVLRYTDGPERAVAAVLGSEADGGYAELVAVRADRVHDVTDSPLGDEQLACLPVSNGTATGMLERAVLAAGDTVLVTGASGGVGLALVGLAAARGLRVVALSSGAKVGPVRAAGATTVIDRADGDVAEQLADLVPGGLDAVLDVVAGHLVGTVLPHLRPGGRWVVAGAVGGPVVELDLRRLYLRSIALVGSTMHTPSQFETLVADARAGRVSPTVARSYPLAAAADAHRDFERREHVGKLVLLP